MVPWRQNLAKLGEIWTPDSKILGEIWTPDLKRGSYEPRTGGDMSRGRYENAPKMNLCLNFVTFIIKLDFLKHSPIGTIRWWRRIQGEMGRWIRRSITRASSPSSCTTSASISSWDRHSDDNISSCCCHLELEKAVVVSTSSSLIWLLLLS